MARHVRQRDDDEHDGQDGGRRTGDARATVPPVAIELIVIFNVPELVLDALFQVAFFVLFKAGLIGITGFRAGAARGLVLPDGEANGNEKPAPSRKMIRGQGEERIDKITGGYQASSEFGGEKELQPAGLRMLPMRPQHEADRCQHECEFHGRQCGGRPFFLCGDLHSRGNSGGQREEEMQEIADEYVPPPGRTLGGDGRSRILST